MEYAGLKLCLRLQGLHVFLPWFNQSLVLFLSSSRLGAEGPTFKITGLLLRLGGGGEHPTKHIGPKRLSRRWSRLSFEADPASG